MLTCPHCSRHNPDDALFCFLDGSPLGQAGRDSARLRRFPRPFVFPSGRTCLSYDELVLACLDEWQAAASLLRDGTLAAFFGGLGRADLVTAARDASRGPDEQRGLDDLLRSLPGCKLEPARLAIDPVRISLGRLRPGEDVQHTLRIHNAGQGLLHGSIASDVPWLIVGEGEGNTARLFRCVHDATLSVRILGRALRAGPTPLLGRLTITSSGGDAVIEVPVEVPSTPFSAGVLAGSRNPRQLAEKARANPRESARWFESGAVARWYQENGWTYPVEGELATGVAAVQQFFDALGLSSPPTLHLSEQAIRLTGGSREALHHTLRLFTHEKRPVYARASSDQPWLVVRGIDLEGSAAHVHLSVPTVPDRAGETLCGTLSITGNARQRFTVPVTLEVRGGRPAVPPNASTSSSGLDWLPASSPVLAIASVPQSPPRSVEPIPPAPSVTSAPTWVPVQQVPLPTPTSVTLPPPPPPPPRVRRRKGTSVGWVLVPVCLVLLLGVGGLVLALARPDRDRPQARAKEKKEPIGEKPQAGKVVRAETSPDRASRPNLLKPPIEDPQPLDDGDVLPRDVGRGSAPPVILLPEFDSREVEVVFCLDTTGSMGGLLDGAKQKIWSICNQIAGGKPTPHLKVGLVAYRDRGDDYVTRVTNLTRDLDHVHQQLHGLSAGGGGDTPESVNQALDDAVNKIEWSTHEKTLRIIFLVGDAPPHLDYPDDVQYPVTCKKAAEKAIIVNTIQCGRDADCTRHWKEIATLGRGDYVAIAQTGGVITVTTPHDADLAALGRRILDTALIHGDDREKSRGKALVAGARRLTGPAAADRAAFAAKSKRIGPYDLLDAIQAKRVKLADVPVDQLPDALKDLPTRADREAHLEKVAKQRAELYEEALKREKQRAEAIAVERARGGARAGFDDQVLTLLRKQAKKFGIEY